MMSWTRFGVRTSNQTRKMPHFNALTTFPLSSLAMGVRGGVFTLTFARLNLRLRNHLFRTLMRQEIAFFDENHTGN